MQGLILLDKPGGITSFGAVARVKRTAHEKRVGHTGTLDPMATGVLPVLLGRATALSGLLLDADKRYTAEIKLGTVTDTDDITGSVLLQSAVNVTEKELEDALLHFTGKIKQRPPAYSALKKDGVPMYRLARQGDMPEIPEREVEIFDRDAIVETLNFAFPTILTSGSILSVCGFLIGSMTSEPVIAGIGESLGRGTVISMFLVMFVLPQILLIGSGIVDKTSFSVPSVAVGGHKTANGRTYVNGMVSGRINGTIRGAVHAVVEGDIDLNLVSGSANDEEADDDETK